MLDIECSLSSRKKAKKLLRDHNFNFREVKQLEDKFFIKRGYDNQLDLIKKSKFDGRFFGSIGNLDGINKFSPGKLILAEQKREMENR